MNRQLLEQPFSQDQIKQRKGALGNTLEYVEAHVVIQRLNDAFDGNWSFEIIKHEINADADEVIVLGKLVVEQITKSQFGSSRITRNSDTKEIVSLADDLKAAATDSLKKCATMLGVGLHLYQGKSPSQPPANGGGNNNSSTNNSSAGNGNSRLTSKQHSYIQRLANEQGLTKRELNDRCREVYGCVSDHLTKDQASHCIDQMLA
ncbi:MAG: Rad52/Rad22 family DNA repair protein [Thermodesulfobacteriota bacterium]